jgi:hypothetical protein
LNSHSSNQAAGKRSSVPWHGISWDVFGRIGLLFIALCAIKLVMLVGFRKHLFEIHWRFNLPPENWLNRTAFYIFAVLTGLNLWRFGKKCSVAGTPVVRMANLCVLTLGAFFIFLTFHIGNKNYLYPLLDGTLKWWELKSYLSLNFFFQAPFLAGWLFIYALIYYGLVRTGREHLALYLTAICAVFYLTFFLQDLAAYGNALLVADCLGVVCLLTGFVSPRPLNWFCLMLPWVWLGVLFLILCPEDRSRTYLHFVVWRNKRAGVADEILFCVDVDAAVCRRRISAVNEHQLYGRAQFSKSF